ncbi:hypothetical protein PG984_004647 [Apiospora sp. TS-2023a]
MGGSESSNSGSGDDGGRSGYDVTRTASIITFTKVEFFLAFGIMMLIMIILVLDLKNIRDNLTDFAWDDL